MGGVVSGGDPLGCLSKVDGRRVAAEACDESVRRSRRQRGLGVGISRVGDVKPRQAYNLIKGKVGKAGNAFYLNLTCLGFQFRRSEVRGRVVIGMQEFITGEIGVGTCVARWGEEKESWVLALRGDGDVRIVIQVGEVLNFNLT